MIEYAQTELPEFLSLVATRGVSWSGASTASDSHEGHVLVVRGSRSNEPFELFQANRAAPDLLFSAACA